MLGACTPSATFGTTTAQVILAHPGQISHIVLFPGTAASVLTVFDNATAGSGTVLAYLNGIANGSSVIFNTFGSPIEARKGITCALSGAASGAQIFYLPDY